MIGVAKLFRPFESHDTYTRDALVGPSRYSIRRDIDDNDTGSRDIFTNWKSNNIPERDEVSSNFDFNQKLTIIVQRYQWFRTDGTFQPS